ncbi:MAG: hypothetical protein EAZ51_07820 [Sphingobacteriales bacterium]|nr:MAG: hypothetical protein EAZ64_05540 [Sphingobacteriales bacterium]TAF79336.1 MAG: hypothetical protein EAZ51_07820 [Sphingobacteriales bacterium]
MKKILLLFVFMTIILPIYAQLEKKTWLLGGSGSFGSSVSTLTYYNPLPPSTTDRPYQKSNVFNLNLTPSFGYFLFDKFALGLKSTIMFTKSEVFNQMLP